MHLAKTQTLRKKFVKTFRILLVGFVLVGVSSCAASEQQSQTSSNKSVPSVSPTGGKFLSEYGIKNGPDGFSLPEGLVFEQVIDQKNVVSLTVKNQATAAEIHSYLGKNLPQMGFTITQENNQAIVFSNEEFTCGWTCSTTICGLSLRKIK